MNLFNIDDLARQFIKAVNETENSAGLDRDKRADLSGTAKAYAFLFDLALNGVQLVGENEESDEEEIDDPSLDPENDYCSCGNMTDNFPVICNQCNYMASID